MTKNEVLIIKQIVQDIRSLAMFINNEMTSCSARELYKIQKILNNLNTTGQVLDDIASTKELCEDLISIKFHKCED